MDPGLLLDLELRHSSVLMLPSPTARRQLRTCTLDLPPAPKAARPGASSLIQQGSTAATTSSTSLGAARQLAPLAWCCKQP